MKGSRVILGLAALLLIVGASTLRAQDDYCMPLTKVVSPGITAVKYNSITFTFCSEDYFNVMFKKLDQAHVSVYIKPVKQGPAPYCEVVVQCGTFPGAEVQVGWPDGETYIFNTETGYAEK